jgi:hypothetical protein
LVLSPSARLREWLDGAEVDAIVTAVVRSQGNAHQAWALLALEGWARRFARAATT